MKFEKKYFVVGLLFFLSFFMSNLMITIALLGFVVSLTVTILIFVYYWMKAIINFVVKGEKPSFFDRFD